MGFVRDGRWGLLGMVDGFVREGRWGLLGMVDGVC